MAKTQRVGKALKGSINLEVIKQIQASMPDGGKWCVWKAVFRENGDTGKEPHALRGGKLCRISSADVTRWVDFDTACGWLDFDGADGLGVLIGSNPKPTEKNPNPVSPYSTSGLVGVDIDKCLDEFGNLIDDGRPLTALAIEDMQKAGVYIERSPSGRGLRALWIGNKAQGFKEAENKREMYDSTSTRYLTITGDVWGVESSPPALVKLDVEFAADIADSLELAEPETSPEDSGKFPSRNMSALSDAEIIQKIKQSRQGKAKKLFDGDMSEYANDWSSADAGLCRAICHWTDDSAQVVRVWEASALSLRDKFKRKYYRDRTIAVALASARKDAVEKSRVKQAKTEQLRAAVEAGDSGGALTAMVAKWGGKVPQTFGACVQILHLDKRLAGAFAFDTFSQQLLKLRSLHECLGEVAPPEKPLTSGQRWTDTDDRTLCVWLEREWGLVQRVEVIGEAVEQAARHRPINTVVEVLEGLIWDGKKRLSGLLVDYFNADIVADSVEYLEAIGRAWMIACVARVYEPGCKHDCVLTMQGLQGAGKSSAVKTLAEAIAPDTFREGLPSLGVGVEAERALSGAWIIELSELACLSKSEAELVKSFLSKMVDSIRHPYARRSEQTPRTVSFAATTNQTTFIRDSTGGRRWWVFKVARKIDIDKLREEAPQLWAEAVAAYKAGEKWFLHDAKIVKLAEAAQWRRMDRDGWDEIIEDKLINELYAGKLGSIRDFDMQFLDIWRLVRGEENEFQKHSKAFADALTRCGLEKRTSGGRSLWRASEKFILEYENRT